MSLYPCRIKNCPYWEEEVSQQCNQKDYDWMKEGYLKGRIPAECPWWREYNEGGI